jgi:hypothetical protein
VVASMPPAEAPMATTIGLSLTIFALPPLEDAFVFDVDKFLLPVFRFAITIRCFD